MQHLHPPSSHPHVPVDPRHRLRRGSGGWCGRAGIGALLAALLALDAHAIALGRAQVWSALGDPLRAEVELSGLGGEETGTLRVEIAPPEAYQEARIEYHPLLSDLRVALERRANGSARVRLHGSHTASVPYLQLLLRVSSNEGQVTRGYTLLLDPNAKLPLPTRELTAGPTARLDARPVGGLPAHPAPASIAPSVPDILPTPQPKIRSAPAPASKPVPVPVPVPVPTPASATAPTAEAPTATATAVPPPLTPVLATPISVRTPPETAPAPSSSTWHDSLLQPPLLAGAAGVIALSGLLVWARRRQQASRLAESIEPAATPAEPMTGADPFSTVLAAALAATAASKPHHAPDTRSPPPAIDTPAGANGLDLDLTALEQAARSTAREQNPTEAGQSGEVPLDFHPTLALEPGRPDSMPAQAGRDHDPMAGQLARLG